VWRFTYTQTSTYELIPSRPAYKKLGDIMVEESGLFPHLEMNTDGDERRLLTCYRGRHSGYVLSWQFDRRDRRDRGGFRLGRHRRGAGCGGHQ